MCISRGTKSVLEAVASSLTEMFSPDIIQERVSGMLAQLRLRQSRKRWPTSTTA